VPKVEHMLGGRPRAAAIVDVHARNPGGWRLVDEHERDRSPRRPADRGRCQVTRIHQRAVHRDVARRFDDNPAGRRIPPALRTMRQDVDGK